jgi:nitrite reductase/ring-hydroxylating ferredoxin subunit
VLAEELVLFRDGRRRPGLVHARCCHRGTTLYYGKVEDRGIRCCYHGWLFDVEGRCLEQPCEPEMGLHRDRVRQPWYPVEERYGLEGEIMNEILKRCQGDLTRENLIKQAASFGRVTNAMVSKGIALRTDPDDYGLFGSLQLIRFDGARNRSLGDPMPAH